MEPSKFDGADDLVAHHRPLIDAEIAQSFQFEVTNPGGHGSLAARESEAVHVDNALPQRARATVSCRILPGESSDEVQRTLARVVADDTIRITRIGEGIGSPMPPLTPTAASRTMPASGAMASAAGSLAPSRPARMA